MVNLTALLGEELGPFGIAVNAVVPTIIDTEANRRVMPRADQRKWLIPDEIAAVIALLADEPTGIVRGTVVRLSRG